MRTAQFHLLAATGAWVCLAGSFSCTSADQQPDRESTSVAPAARHALHSEHLRSLMLTMGSQAARTWPQEIASERAADAEHDRNVRFDRAQQLAAALARAAAQIPQAIQGVQLSEAQRAAFLANVDRLRTQAGELETLAKSHDFDKMHSSLHSIRNTCNGCHSQFRELIGPVDLPANAL